MDRRVPSYDEAPYPEPFNADDPEFEDGPIAAGGLEPRTAKAAVAKDADAGALPESSGSGPALRSPRPASPLHVVLNFVLWTAALAGVFLAVLALEVAGILLASIAVGLLEDFTPLLIGFSDDDQLMFIDIVTQLTWLAAMVPWWMQVRARGIGLMRRPAACRLADQDESPTAQRTVAVILLGVGLQIVISLALTFILPLFPEVMESYDQLMDDAGVTTFDALTVLSVAVLAPVVEEFTFRGVALQFALRAVCPGWSRRATSEELADMRVSSAQFWAANILQALVFGAMHLNIVQGLYAFAIGLVCGWIFWRTGELRWSMGLHAALNFCSYFVGEVLDAMSLFGFFNVGQLVFPVLMVYVGVRLFVRGSEETALR